MVPNPLFSFSLFGKTVSVYLYGIMIAIGLIACLIVYYVYTSKKNINREVQDFGFIVAILSIALGFVFAKLFQAVYDFIETGKFDFYSAGITAMGGFVGGAVVFIVAYFGVGHFIFGRKKNNIHLKDFNKILLAAPCCITIAHAFGRIGCLMAGCCYGEFLGYEPTVGGLYMRCGGTWGYYVPTQLYEALFLFVLFAALSVLYFKDFNITPHVYLIAYGIWRIIIEVFRTDERGAIVLGLAPSQWMSIIFMVGGAALFLLYYLKKIPFRFKNAEKQAQSLLAAQTEETELKDDKTKDEDNK